MTSYVEISHTPDSAYKGVNSSSTLIANRQTILSLFFRFETLTRKQLIQMTSLKGATITIIINELLEKDLIRKTGTQDGGQGRRVAQFSFNHSKFCCVASMIYFSYIRIGVYDTNQVLLKDELITLDTFKDMEKTLDILSEAYQRLISSFSNRTCIGFSVAVDGNFEYLDDELVYKNPNSLLPVSFSDALKTRLGFTPIINRTLHFAAYEIHHANHFPSDAISALLYFYDDSVMCGLTINDQNYKGYNGNSGNIGMISVGSLDGSCVKVKDVLSIESMLRRANELLSQYPDSVLHTHAPLEFHDLRDGCYQGDECCIQLFDEVSYYLGQLISTVINFIDPINVIIGDFFPITDRFISRTYYSAQTGLSQVLSQDFIITQHLARSADGPAFRGGVRYIQQAWISSLFTE